MLKDVYITRDWAHLFLIIPWSDLVLRFFSYFYILTCIETKGYTVWLADLSWRHPTWEEHVFWVVQFLVTVSVRPPLLSIVCLVKHAVWSVIKNVLVFLPTSIFAQLYLKSLWMLSKFIRVFPLFTVALLHKTNILFCYLKVNRIELLLMKTSFLFLQKKFLFKAF